MEGIADAVGAGGDLALGVEAGGGAVLQHEHQQPVIVLDPAADQLAIGIDRHFGAVERAFKRDILQLLHAKGEGGFPGLAKAGGLGVAAQEIGALWRHVDAVGGGLDAAGERERLNKAALAFFGPAIVALLFARDGGEIGDLAGGGGELALVDRHRAGVLCAGGAGEGQPATMAQARGCRKMKSGLAHP